ncbi:formylglycine-generating enzyme family protein [filamentous cyanobacterium LEGE 11480]|uniref:Formylglycine-generating enzyme family protein n=2 Tax=Romeriopsis TaxID=2992131 RepID=A0A928Z6W6_9CYAN|nr:formylglycine-generating enzyme family protein [Romeriopsis navalis LEGE 11480]
MNPERYVFQDGEKILLAQAVVADPRQAYRKLVEKYGLDGEIRATGKAILRRNRLKLDLPEDVAKLIQDEVLLPYRLHQENLTEYEAVLREELAIENPLGARTLAELKDLQKLLGLTDKSVEEIWINNCIRVKSSESVGDEDLIPPSPPSKGGDMKEVSEQVNGSEKATLKVPLRSGDLGGSPTTQPTENSQINTFQTDLGNGVFLDMIRIPAGEFWMGSVGNEESTYDDGYPRHRVKVPEFWMGKFAVTQAQWSAVAKLPKVKQDLEANPSKFKGADLPIEQVSWFDAVEFCDRLVQKTGNTYRLPSEAEWEYACRAGTETPFHFGTEISSKLANYGKNHKGTIDVGSFSPNDFGLYDTHGNVWEWCMDDWHNNYQGAPDDGSAWMKISETASRKVRRGGSWGDFPRDCRSAYRSYDDPGSRNYFIGFRVMCCSPRTLA